MMNVVHRIALAIAAAVAVAFTPIACLGAGYVGAVAVQGDYAYVGINRAVVVVDISDPHHPTPVGQTSFWPDNREWFVEDVKAISVVGDHVYVVYDVGGYSGRSHSMVIVNVSRPAAPEVIASYDVSGWPPSSGHALGVTASGQYAYLYHTTGLDVVDNSKPMEPTQVGRWRTHSSPGFGRFFRGPYVAITGNYAYVADRGGGLRVLDISDPTDPKEVGSCASVHCQSVTLVGNRAFVGSGIIDIRDPANPKVIGSCRPEDMDRGERTVGAVAAGDYAFWYGNALGDPTMGRGNLYVVDVSDPSAPEKIFKASDPPLIDGCIMSLAVEGNYAYIGVGPRLVVADVSDPKNLSVLGSTEVLPCKLTDIAVAGDHAFLASGRGGLRVLDISDADSPKEVGSFPALGAIATVTAWGNYAFAGEQDVLHVLDISDPKTLREVAPYRIEKSAPKAVDDENDEDVEQLTIAGDADELEELEELEEFVFEFPPRAPEVAIVNNYACLAVDGKMLKILDISDPTAPKEMGSYEEEVGPKRVAAYGDHVLMLYELGGSFSVVDLSPLAWTTRMPYLKAVALAASSGLALLVFLARRPLNRFVLFPVRQLWRRLIRPWVRTDRQPPVNRYPMLLAIIVVVVPPALLVLMPKAPHMVGRYVPPGFAEGLAVAERHAYIVGARHDARGSMLWVLDVSNPASPRKIGSCELSQWGRATDVAVAGKYAYVVDDSHALHVVDVTNPAAPKVIGSHSASIPSGWGDSGDHQAVAVAGQHVLVTDGHWGMRVFDVTDPASPKPVCFYDSPLGP